MRTPPPPQRTALARSEAGIDVHDIETVYRAHSRQCYALALRIVRDPQLAQDVIQEVFTLVHRQPIRFDPARGSLSTWLMTLTHHKAVDAVRTTSRKTRLDVPLGYASELVDAAASPEATAIANDEGGRVRAAMGVLTRVEREVIQLAYFDGYTQSEIAARIAIPLGTVKSRTLSGLRRLKAQLTPEPGPAAAAR